MTQSAIKKAFDKVKFDITELSSRLDETSKKLRESDTSSLNSKLFKELQKDIQKLEKEIERIDKKTQVSFEDFASHMTEKIQLEISQLRLEMTDHLIDLENRVGKKKSSKDDLLY